MQIDELAALLSDAATVLTNPNATPPPDRNALADALREASELLSARWDEPVPAKYEPAAFVHCAQCMKDWQERQAAARQGRVVPKHPLESVLEVGYTPQGIGVRCMKHGSNVLHLNLCGLVVPANTSA